MVGDFSSAREGQDLELLIHAALARKSMNVMITRIREGRDDLITMGQILTLSPTDASKAGKGYLASG